MKKTTGQNVHNKSKNRNKNSEFHFNKNISEDFRLVEITRFPKKSLMLKCMVKT